MRSFLEPSKPAGVGRKGRLKKKDKGLPGALDPKAVGYPKKKLEKRINLFLKIIVNSIIIYFFIFNSLKLLTSVKKNVSEGKGCNQKQVMETLNKLSKCLKGEHKTWTENVTTQRLIS